MSNIQKCRHFNELLEILKSGVNLSVGFSGSIFLSHDRMPLAEEGLAQKKSSKCRSYSLNDPMVLFQNLEKKDSA